MLVLLIDNYDSFTYNFVQRIGELDPSIDMHVVRNDRITVDEALRLEPDRILLSPGPCTPAEAGVCTDIVPAFRGRVPILGVCLGHQCIGAVHGMVIRRADVIMHGKTSDIEHDGRGIFTGLPNPFTATRYHSLIVDPSTVPPEQFEVSAWTDDGVIMGLRWKPDAHADRKSGDAGQRSSELAPLDGIQFHPESFLTTDGPMLLANFLNGPGQSACR